MRRVRVCATGRARSRALALDFETVIPGHSGVTDRATVEGYRDHLLDMQSIMYRGRPDDLAGELQVSHLASYRGAHNAFNT